MSKDCQTSKLQATIASTISSLCNIIQQLPKLLQSSLQALDHVVMRYIQTRALTKISNNISSSNNNNSNVNATHDDGIGNSQQLMSIDSELDMLSQQKLQQMHCDTQMKYIKLKNNIQQYNTNKQSLSQHNNRILQQLHDHNITNTNYQQLCISLITQLSKYADIHDFYAVYVRVSSNIIGRKDYAEFDNFVQFVQKYINHVDHVLAIQQQQHYHDNYSYNHNSDSDSNSNPNDYSIKMEFDQQDNPSTTQSKQKLQVNQNNNTNTANKARLLEYIQ